ncbi:hypothetical protein [Marinimicrococcus flavescens]|uniref:Uncharacterized protein n=1 Tax=Marinimicrococcus flavescens TaxID=3031815 RepID=A0AAP3XRZ2_9PROT|nr:hypothetical protein [Marinimicrococcus flavescens]
MPSPRKYLAEVAIGLCTRGHVIIPADQIHADGEMPQGAVEILENCHIYLICRRPYASFDPATFTYDGRACSGALIYREDAALHRVPFTFQVNADISRLDVDPYPHRQLVGYDAFGTSVRYWPASMLSLSSAVPGEDLRSFEVLYVGQAYGDGSRNALDRLRKHETLQKILAKSLATRPHDEIMLFAFDYAPPQVFSHIDGRSAAAACKDIDKAHWIDAHTIKPDKQSQVALAEAGLIRYFSPPYNKIYKHTFPEKTQKLLEYCYKLDFSALIVEINTEETYTPLYSSNVTKGVHHIAAFDLHDPQKRRSFFSMTNVDGDELLMKHSGPVY